MLCHLLNIIIKLNLLLCLPFFFGCQSKDNCEENDFEKCIGIVNEYDSYKGILNDTNLAKFYFATEFLERVTNIKGSFIIADVPYYKSRGDCLSDISNWVKWYNRNGQSISQIKLDSIKKAIAKENIWWNDSTILGYVFE